MTRPLTALGSEEGGFSTAYELCGDVYELRDSALNALLVQELFADSSLTPEDKAGLLHRMLFADPDEAAERAGDAYWDVVADAMREAFGIDLSGPGVGEEPCFDWDEDAGRIRASLLQAYGLRWDDVCSRISFAEACDLIAGLMETGETPLQQAVYYRVAEPPKETKTNREYVRAWRERREHYRLRGRETDEDAMGRQADAMAAAFASEFACAERNREA